MARKDGQEFPKQVQELFFQDIDPKHDNIRKILAPFADMWSEKLGCIDAVEHRIGLTRGSRPLRSAPYRAGSKV